MPASKYLPAFAEIAAALYRRGADDEAVADVLRVTRRTLTNWRRAKPEFRGACAEGKALADSRIESALYKRALGYRYDEVTREVAPDVASGEPAPRITKIVTKEVAGEPSAMYFWLCNRRPDLWRHVNRVEHTGAEGGPIQHEVEYANLSDEELEAAIVQEAERITGGAGRTSQPEG